MSNEPGQPPSIVPMATHDLPISIDLAPPPVALAIGAHPDDVEFGCGATLAKWAAAGCIVHHLVCTDGAKGTWDPTADRDALTARRQREQREAARRLAGDRAGTVVFLGVVDGELSSDLATRSRVAKVIRELRPTVVLGHDPWRRYRLHPDHRNAGLLACEAIVAARDPHFFPEHELAPHRPAHLLLWEADVVNHLENIGAWVDAKLAALEAHESQFESTMKAVDSRQLADFRARIRSRLASIGEPHGLPAAEQFHLIDDL